MGLSREQVSLFAAQLRELPDPIRVGKQEAVRLLLPDIEALKARGLSNRIILDALRELGLEIGTLETLRSYIQRARKATRGAQAVNALPFRAMNPNPSVSQAIPERANSKTDEPSRREIARPPAEVRTAVRTICAEPRSSAPKPGHFIPVLHRVDDDL